MVEICQIWNQFDIKFGTPTIAIILIYEPKVQWPQMKLQDFWHHITKKGHDIIQTDIQNCIPIIWEWTWSNCLNEKKKKKKTLSSSEYKLCQKFNLEIMISRSSSKWYKVWFLKHKINLKLIQIPFKLL